MTRSDRGGINGSRGSTQEFLFYRKGIHEEDNRADDSEILSSALYEENLIELSKVFPDKLSGKAFIRAAMAGLYTSAVFSVMGVRVASFPGSDPKESGHRKAVTREIFINTALVIDSVCSLPYPCGGLWGLLDYEIFGCFFPEKDEQECLKSADILRNDMAKQNISLNIGIASYPAGRFGRDQIADNARKALDHSVISGPDTVISFDAVSLNISGDRLYQEGKLYAAAEEFRTALLLDPLNPTARNSLGVCYGVLKLYEKALEEFEFAIRMNPQDSMAVYNAGLIHVMTGNKDKALECFFKAEEIGGDVFEAAFQIGKLYLEAGEVEKAKTFLEKATRLKPSSAMGFRYLGDCYAAMNMSDEAIRTYKKAIKQNPYDAASLSAIGYLFDIKGENPEIAAVFCQHSVELAPENGLFRHRLGMLYLKQKRTDDALKAFMKATELGHDSMQFIAEIQQMRKEK